MSDEDRHQHLTVAERSRSMINAAENAQNRIALRVAARVIGMALRQDEAGGGGSGIPPVLGSPGGHRPHPRPSLARGRSGIASLRGPGAACPPRFVPVRSPL